MGPYQAYLKCEVSEGMFKGEKAVVVRGLDGKILDSGFFQEELLSEKGLEVIACDERDGTISVGTGPMAQAGYGFFGSSRVIIPKELVTRS